LVPADGGGPKYRERSGLMMATTFERHWIYWLGLLVQFQTRKGANRCNVVATLSWRILL
jgi:hypothetical protein